MLEQARAKTLLGSGSNPQGLSDKKSSGFIRQNSTKKAWAHHGRRICRGKGAGCPAPLTRHGHGKLILFEPVNFLSATKPGYRGRTRPSSGHGKPTLFEPVNFLSATEPGYRGRTRPSRTSRQGWTGGWMCLRPRRTSRRVGRQPKAEEDEPPRSDRPIPRPRRTGPLGQGRRPPTRAVGVVHGNCATMSSVGVVHGAGGAGGASPPQPFQLCARPRPSARHRPGAHRRRGVVGAVLSAPHHPLLAPHCWRHTIGTASLAPHHWRRIIGAVLLSPYHWRRIIGDAS